ncbi:MAG: T9SS type A sorting domain-containing protein [Bacteroidales bacterium]|nr:T9SS type A sorting domain-containing protein [Bacteroidales bacterium]
MKFLNKILFFLLVLNIPLCVTAQEIMVSLSSYRIKDVQNIKAEQRKTSLSLPFFDDFSRQIPFPTADLWESSAVISNQNYAINPPTVGVATFDAINRKGELYSTLTTTSQTSDTLTSLPINLAYPATDSIYLSFSFQPMGLGNAPEPGDSLILEFYAPSEGKWYRAWAASYGYENNTLFQTFHIEGTSKTDTATDISSTFHDVRINIFQSDFLVDGFRFRFMNYASIAENPKVPGLRSNCDHWHIDLVYLDKSRYWDDPMIYDVAFTEPIKKPMTNYTSVPWKHFPDAFNSEFTDPIEFPIEYENFTSETWGISRRFELHDLSGSQETYYFTGGAENIEGHSTINYSRKYLYDFQSAWTDSAKYLLKTYIITDNDPEDNYLRYNDTLTYTQVFDNYYAMDDGSAESGYGVFGEGSGYGMVAQKFYNYTADSLTGVMIYFNRTFNDANNISFKVTVWDDNNGIPGNILYETEKKRPKFTDSLNVYSVYRLSSTQIPVGYFYIGWQQFDDEYLNVGIDRNSDNQSNLFYNLNGNWNNTTYQGTLMIRPIFGNLHQTPTLVPTQREYAKLTIFPNPASSVVNITIPNNFNASGIKLIGTNASIINLPYTSGQSSFSITNIPSGFYIVRVYNSQGNCLTGKLIVTP